MTDYRDIHLIMLPMQQVIRYLRIALLLKYGIFAVLAVFYSVILIYSRNDTWSIILLSIATLSYLYVYINLIENRYLKNRILKDKDRCSKSYNIVLFATRLLSFLVFVFLEASSLFQLAKYNPASVGIIFFLMIQFFVIIYKLDLVYIEKIFGKLPLLRDIFLFFFFFIGIIILAFCCFLLGLFSLLNGFANVISVNLFITMISSSLLGLFLFLIKQIAKFIKPINK